MIHPSRGGGRGEGVVGVELSATSSWLFDTFLTLRWEYSELGSNWIVAKDEGPALTPGNSNTIVTCYVFHSYEKSFFPTASS